MSRKLLLLRHAEAAPAPMGDFSTVADHARPLTAAGLAAAQRCGLWLRQQGLSPDYVVCSPAVRTRQTLEGLLPFLHAPLSAPLFCPDIYEAPPHALLAQIQKTPPQARTVLLIGHNPGISALARQLDTQAAVLDQGFATGSLAVFKMWGSTANTPQPNWQSCDTLSLTLDTFSRP
ncbi:SixA phosphatase family protein [Acetobacter orientalis]|uniref:SixA phosphatase family protein n=1 Tax=Acetobacter orientalis TaxID=146474 RepID=UPI0039EAC735